MRTGKKGVALMLNTLASHDRPKHYCGRLSFFVYKNEDDLRFWWSDKNLNWVQGSLEI